LYVQRSQEVNNVQLIIVDVLASTDDTVKDPGVILDTQLLFKNHVDVVVLVVRICFYRL